MAFFGRFFKASKLSAPVDMRLVGCDLHSHLIPGIDDGVRSLEESLSLIDDFVQMGYRKLVITPHIMTDFYRNTPTIVTAGADDLQRALRERDMGVDIEVAAEYMVDSGFEEKLFRKELMTFGDNYVLVEFSYLNPPANYKQLIFHLQTEGYRVVLAHPERYSYWHESLSVFDDLLARGVKLQLNLVALSGFYGNQVRQIAERLIEMKAYSFVGSDMHNHEYMDAMQNALREPLLEKLIDTNPLLNKEL